MEKNRLKDLLLNHTREEIQEEIDDIHPADLLELLEETEDEDQRRELLNDIPDDIVADIVEEMKTTSMSSCICSQRIVVKKSWMR